MHKLFCLLILALCAGCATKLPGEFQFESSQKNGPVGGPYNALHLTIDVNALQLANTFGMDRDGLITQVNDRLSKAFVKKFAEANVAVKVKIVDLRSEVTQSGNTTTTKTFTRTPQEIFAGVEPRNQRALMIHISRYQQSNSQWTGLVGWELKLVDPSAWVNDPNQQLWRGKTSLMQFGQAACGPDAYVTCADRFADAVVTQLRAEQIVK